jgi:hypothetical protein
VQNRFSEMLLRAIRQIACIVMILFGSLLALNANAGPCGGTALSLEPFPAIFVSIFGLELIVCSYFLVKKLNVEADFRVVIYLFLLVWSLSLLLVATDLARYGMPQAAEDRNDFYFSSMRGFSAFVNLALFYRWAGARNMITRLW